MDDKTNCTCLLSYAVTKEDKNSAVKTRFKNLEFWGQAAVGSYLMITDSNIRLLGS